MLRRYRLLKHYYCYILPLLENYLHAERKKVDECLQMMFLPEKNEPPLLQSDQGLEKYIHRCLEFIAEEFQAEPHYPTKRLV